MATYAIGDIQGCYDELSQLLEKIRFDSTQDTLWCCGDLVNRGGQSLAVLRRLCSFGPRVVVTLGNHDLSLLAIAQRKPSDQEKVNSELREILLAPDREELLYWLRMQPLLKLDRSLNFMMIHASLAPSWDIEQAQMAAHEVEERLHGENFRRLLAQMFGNKPDIWSQKLRGMERLRASINVLTRARYYDARGRIAFNEKGALGTQKPGCYPWFAAPGQPKRDIRIVCGHWSTLGRYHGGNVYGIDTGCVWGNELTALRLDLDEPEFISVKSSRAKSAANGD